jgi:energy-coupling factor transport system ATP-binding protein
LSGGAYFATETARILGGAGGALRPEEGAALIRARLGTEEEAGAEAVA